MLRFRMGNFTQYLQYLALILVIPVVGAFAEESAHEPELSMQQAQKILLSQVAERHDLAVEDIEVVSAEARTWLDGSLGCPARRRLPGGAPVSGYVFELQVEGRRMTYHASNRGVFMRCDKPAKPIAPIA